MHLAGLGPHHGGESEGSLALYEARDSCDVETGSRSDCELFFDCRGGGIPGFPAYTASKHGVVGLTQAAALECARSHIRINAVCPGVIQTPMIDRYVNGDERIRKSLAEREPMGRLGNPSEVADAVHWLASDRASFVTGVALPVDGGWLAQ